MRWQGVRFSFTITRIGIKFHYSLAESFEKGFNHAVKMWEFGQSPETRHFAENYDLITDNLESILAILDIRVDYPGLYPTYELTRKGKKLS